MLSVHSCLCTDMYRSGMTGMDRDFGRSDMGMNRPFGDSFGGLGVYSCLCVCVLVYMIYDDTNVYNDMANTM